MKDYFLINQYVRRKHARSDKLQELFPGRWAFIFIGGIQPKKVELDQAARCCPACGRLTLRHRRRDAYLSLFFVPLVRVKAGAPHWECDSCGRILTEAPPAGSAVLADARRPAAPAAPAAPAVCPACGGATSPGHNFCPACGQRLRPWS